MMSHSIRRCLGILCALDIPFHSIYFICTNIGAFEQFCYVCISEVLLRTKKYNYETFISNKFHCNIRKSKKKKKLNRLQLILKWIIFDILNCLQNKITVNCSSILNLNLLWKYTKKSNRKNVQIEEQIGKKNIVIHVPVSQTPHRNDCQGFLFPLKKNENSRTSLRFKYIGKCVLKLRKLLQLRKNITCFFSFIDNIYI